MTNDAIIGVDVGVLDVSAVAFDRAGRSIVQTAARPPLPSIGLDAIAAAIQDVAAQLAAAKRKPAALAVVGEGEAASLVAQPAGTGPRRLTATMAAETGLDPKLPVCVGPAAQIAAALAAGLPLAPEADCVVVGPTPVLLRRLRAPEDRTVDLPDGLGSLVVQDLHPGAGIVWMLDLARYLLAEFDAAASRSAALERFDHAILAAPPGELLVQSAQKPSRPSDEAARRSHVFGLSTRHGYPHLLRGAIEALAFAVRDAASAGAMPAEIRIIGDGAGSSALSAIMAAVCATPVRAVRCEQAAAAGSAMMAAVAIGQEPDLQTCVARWTGGWVGEPIDPDPALVIRYNALSDHLRCALVASGPVRESLF